MDLDPDQYLQVFGGEDIFLPAAEAFPEMVVGPPLDASPLRSTPLRHTDEPSSQHQEAVLRRKPRVPKVLPRDNITELRNADLARWYDNYIANMISEARLKLQHKATRLSKRNARQFFFDSGIGGAGSRFSAIKLSGPLEIFSGANLLEALTGVNAAEAGKKRPHQKDADSDTEGRRVRPRESDGDQIGRGNELALNEDEALAILPGEVSYPELFVNYD